MDGNLVYMATLFETIGTPDEAYWLGFLAADGGLSKYQVKIVLAGKDADHVRAFAKFAGCNAYDGEARCRGKLLPIARASISSVDVVAALAQYGIVQNKSFTVTPWVGPDELMPHYWRGVVDGDGWVTARDVTYKGKVTRYWNVGLCGNKAMVEGFRDFVNARTGHEMKVSPDKSIWCTKLYGIRKPQDVAHVLYGVSGPALERKAVVARELLQAQPKTRRWNLTAARLNDLLAANGTWEEVAAHLGTQPSEIRRLRRRAGMQVG